MNSFDCSKNYCPTCDSSANFPCTGVIGGNVNKGTPFGNGPAGPYGSMTQFIKNLRDTDKSDRQSVICSDKNNLGWYTNSGSCGGVGSNNLNIMQNKTLVVGSKKTNGTIIDNNLNWDKFPLQTLHKIWGDGGGKFNHGVNNKNVYISNLENINYKIPGKNSVQVKQKVIIMEAHGDKYEGLVPGLQIRKNNNKHIIPTCPIISESIDLKHRVGGVITTRRQFGPGVYNILCYIPKTEDKSNDGRGYVFAAWPFHYEEIYIGKNPINNAGNSQARGSLEGTLGNDIHFPCYNQCDGGDHSDEEAKCIVGCTGEEHDLFSVINHEIDIEIPCNSPQFANDWENKMTWDTMNCNTWINDINNYEANTGAYYTQVANKNPVGTFISKATEDNPDKDYHWYTIDWFVNNDDFTKNYVKFYFDDPFDPTGKTFDPNGKLLPKKPSGVKISDKKGYGLVHSTRRFVPTRAGRFNVGPWFGWWGYNGNNNGKPNFDTAKVRLAFMNIIPYPNSGFNFPQNFDQITPHGTLTCDFKNLYQMPGPRPNPPKPPKPPKPPNPPNPPKHNNKILLGLGLGLGIPLILILISILIIILIKKKK